MKKIIAIIVFVACVFSFTIVASAHSGDTDANGGHYDNNNVSGLGDYHYHHGYGPHLHPGGVCPYAESQSSPGSQTVDENGVFDPSAEEMLDFIQADEENMDYEELYNDLLNENATLKSKNISLTTKNITLESENVRLTQKDEEWFSKYTKMVDKYNDLAGKYNKLLGYE